jgi:hypothetical protein
MSPEAAEKPWNTVTMMSLYGNRRREREWTMPRAMGILRKAHAEGKGPKGCLCCDLSGMGGFKFVPAGFVVNGPDDDGT